MPDHTHQPPNPTGRPRRLRTIPPQTSFWKSKAGLVAIAFLGIGAFFLVTEHQAHLLGLLPWLVLLASVFLHLFMHGGHGGHGGHGNSDAEAASGPDVPAEKGT